MSQIPNTVNEEIRNEAAIKYAQILLNSKPEFLRMVYDTYTEFDEEGLEQTVTNSNLNNENIHNKSILGKLSQIRNKGFFQNVDQFLKGNEYNKWNENVTNVLQKINKKSIMLNEDKTFPALKSLNFIKNQDIPKKPEKKFNNNFTPVIIEQIIKTNTQKSSLSFQQNNIEIKENENLSNSLLIFNFKRNLQKFLTFSSVANIQEDKISNYIHDIVVNKNVAQLIKLVDFHHENRMVFINKIATDENGNELLSPALKNVDFTSLAMRSEILTYSRFSNIQKIAIIINKFLTSLKKVCKNKKEKENRKELNLYSNIEARRDKIQSQGTSRKNSLNSTENITHFNGKFRKEYKDLISARIINLFSKAKQMDIKIIKKLLAIKNKEKGEINKKNKLSNIKDKALILLKKKREEELGKGMEDSLNRIQMEDYGEEDDLEDDILAIEDNLPPDDEIVKKPNIELSNVNAFKKRKSMNPNQLYPIVHQLTEEKVLDVRPKKKVNYVGLKMFINEEMNRLNSNIKK